MSLSPRPEILRSPDWGEGESGLLQNDTALALFNNAWYRLETLVKLLCKRAFSRTSFVNYFVIFAREPLHTSEGKPVS